MHKRILFFSVPLLILSASSLSCTTPVLPGGAERERKRNELRAELKIMCDNLPPPLEFRKVSKSEMIKPDRGSYGFWYEAKINCEQVKDHYSNVLLSQGWLLKEENSTSIITSYSKTDLFYHKGEHSIRITCEKRNSTSSKKEYSLSCSRSINSY